MKEDKAEIYQNEYYIEEQSLVVDPGQSPLRIDKFLSDKLQQVTRNKIQNGIKASSITVNGKEVKANYKVRPGDIIHMVFPKYRKEQDSPIPEDIPLDIFFEDESLLIINKPPGLVVHPGISNHSGTLVNGLVHYFKYHLPVMEGNSPDRPGIVHRIDKDTSGLMVIAKNEFSLSFLAKQFFDKTIHREYVALVWGDFENDEGTITGSIGRHPKERTKMCVYEEGEGGKQAVTHYEVVERFYYVTLVKCWLETGRTHQIRVHMSHIGHPVFNDEKYGGNEIVKGTVFTKYKQFVQNCFKIMTRQALHAKSIGFIHPESKKEVNFDSELPEDMRLVLDKWRRYLKGRQE